jgi:hypothetical protein
MIINIEGIIDKKDDDYNKKHIAYMACLDAGIEPPEELEDLIDNSNMTEKGPTVDITKDMYEEIDDEDYIIFDVDLTKIDNNIRYIRVKIE